MQIVTPHSKQDWHAYYDLRWQLLRAPWQQPKGSEQDELEQSAYHAMAKTDDGETVGVGRIHSIAPKEWQIRYMAVHNAHRGKGIGSMLLECLESYALTHGAKRITLNARESAVYFYLHHHYQITGNAPTLFDVIKHKCMQKEF
jgi:GNAT superfamily N-acetyltransferase